MITLAIDTSTPHGSVALLSGGSLTFEERFSAHRSHSASLFVSLENVRARADRVDQIVIGLGPGSYAGVRIAIAAAMGLRLALGGKLAGIPSVAALDTTAPGYIVIGDARRESFYFSRIENGVCVEGPLLSAEVELAHRLSACGALPVYATEAVREFSAAHIALPSAALLARLASRGRGIVATDTLEPIYLREPHITPPKPRRS